MCCTPARVSSTMIQTANMKTVAITVGVPSPSRIMITGTSAESGAYRNMLTHMFSILSAAGARPMRKPSGTPTTSASASPMT